MSIGSFVPIELSSGDTGVQRVNWWQQSASMTSGGYNLVAYRPIASVDAFNAGVTGSADAFQLGMPRLFDNSCLFFLYKANANAGGAVQLYGSLILAQG